MRVITSEIMGYINVFEGVTSALVKDCYKSGDDGLIFIVKEGNAGKAIGKGGENIRRLSSMLKKRVKVVEFSDDASKFVANYIFPARGSVYMRDGATVVVEGRGAKFKEIVLGRER